MTTDQTTIRNLVRDADSAIAMQGRATASLSFAAGLWIAAVGLGVALVILRIQG